MELENDESCLEREVREELSGTRISIGTHYKDFTGITPNKGDELTAKVYLCSLEGNLGEPSAEIRESRWMGYDEKQNYTLSDITSKIVESLRQDVRFTGFN